MPFGAIASKRVRTTESLPGSHPAEIMATALPALADSSSERRSAVICVWISKLSTVLMPIARISFAYFSTLRVGVAKIATSTSFSSFISLTTAYGSSSAGLFSAPLRRTIPAISKSGAASRASTTYLPMLPYPTTAALILFIFIGFSLLLSFI